MTWDADSRRHSELPPDWAARVTACKVKAGGRCEWTYPKGGRCSKPGSDADHYGARDDHSKLRWLCADHHRWRTSRQGNEAKAVIREKRRRPAEPHPGMVQR